MQSELWNEHQTLSQFEIVGSFLRDQLSQEQVVRIDLSYLGRITDQWWSESTNRQRPLLSQRAELFSLISENIKPEHLKIIKSIGLQNSRISAVLLESVYSDPTKTFGLLVHECMSKLARVIDIKYPYEEHKELFPKQTAGVASDWGKGYGIIRPHSDDLYEDRDINIMSLTVLKDTSSTPTWFWSLKDVVSVLNDEELGYFALGEASFYSGTNVDGKTIVKQKPILRSDKNEGLGLRLDFRIDDAVGPRMRFRDDRLEEIFAKLRQGFKKLKPIATNPTTGSVSILANFKVLHGRSSLNPVMLSEGETSRILFRSKGIKQGDLC